MCPDHLIYDSEFKNCVEIPKGIPNCEVYLQDNFCSHCKTNFYLIQNECVSITTTVPNCYWYSNQENCSKCIGGFELKINITTDPLGEDQIETICEAKPVLNCLQFDDVLGLCKECNPNFYLVRENIQENIQSVQSRTQSINSRKLEEEELVNTVSYTHLTLPTTPYV